MKDKKPKGEELRQEDVDWDAVDAAWESVHEESAEGENKQEDQ